VQLFVGDPPRQALLDEGAGGLRARERDEQARLDDERHPRGGEAASLSSASASARTSEIRRAASRSGRRSREALVLRLERVDRLSGAGPTLQSPRAGARLATGTAVRIRVHSG
jgi:hypothetical protein